MESRERRKALWWASFRHTSPAQRFSGEKSSGEEVSRYTECWAWA